MLQSLFESFWSVFVERWRTALLRLDGAVRHGRWWLVILALLTLFGLLGTLFLLLTPLLGSLLLGDLTISESFGLLVSI